MFAFSLVYDLGREIPAHILPLCSTFWETAKLFSKVAAAYYIPTSNRWRFQFLHILVIVHLLNRRHPARCEVISHCDFYLHFPNYWRYWASFHVLFGHLYSLLFLGGGNGYSNSLPIFNWVLCFLIIEWMNEFLRGRVQEQKLWCGERWMQMESGKWNRLAGG